MTEEDRKLVETASRLDPAQWSDITPLIREAVSDEARRELKEIQLMKYRREEFQAGCL